MHARRRLLRRAAAALVATSLCAACGAAGGGPEGGRQELVVLAAASLTDAFEELAERHEAANPGTDVVLDLAGSQDLARQLRDGAPADVFASADESWMAEVDDLVGPPTVFARNGLVVAVEPGNPQGIDGLADLADPGLLVVLANEEVPAGRYARRALDAAGVGVAPVSLEPDVRAALAKVVLGEADAAVVYATDVAAAGNDVQGVPLPPEADVTARYPVAVVDGARDGAQAFVDLVLGAEGQQVLAEHGFLAP